LPPEIQSRHISEEEELKVYLAIAVMLLTVISLSSCLTINNTTLPPVTTVPPATTTLPPATTTPPATTPPMAIPFEDRTWVLEKMGKQDLMAPALDGKEVNIKFDTSSGKVSGSAGCNSYYAAYEKNNNKLTVSTIMATKMLCYPNAVMQQEIQFQNALKDAQNYKVDKNWFTIFCSDDRQLVFKPK
jgi:heat shock protein HslJ